MKSRFILGFLISVFTVLSNLYASDHQVLSSYLLSAPSQEQLDAIAETYEIAHRKGDTFEIIVPAAMRQEFLAIAPLAMLKESDIRAETLRYLSFQEDAYHSYDEVFTELKAITTHFSHLATLENYGKSAQGRPLYGVRLSNNKNSKTPKPTVLLDAATHGDELITTEVLLRILKDLVAEYGHNAEVTRILDEATILVVPVVNADGFSTRNRYESGLRDPNRSYPYPGDTERKPVTCIAALLKYLEKEPLKAVLNLHAYGKLIMYPWGYTKSPLPDTEGASTYDEIVQDMSSHNGYEYGQISKTIYVAKGSSSDYFHWKLGAKAIAVEVGDSKVPPYGQIEEDTRAIKPAVLTFLRHVILNQVSH